MRATPKSEGRRVVWNLMFGFWNFSRMDTIINESIGFNPAPSYYMCVDINSCFATIEQQANPLLRGKPVAVCSYTTPSGCILAASREAKKLGITTGMRVGEGKARYQGLVTLMPDPDKYRYVHHKLVALLREYTDVVEVKSIDEMFLSFRGAVSVFVRRQQGMTVSEAMHDIAREIKRRIKEEIGDWITVSIGIAPNRYLGKIASNLQKPDGLVEINKDSIEYWLSRMALRDLTGIKDGIGARLECAGIRTPLDLYRARIKSIKHAVNSILGYHWWLRIHGWEADDRQFATKSFGQSYALAKSWTPQTTALHQVLSQLVAKMGRRLRRDNYMAQGVHVSCFYKDGSYWRVSQKQPQPLFADGDFYKSAHGLLVTAPPRAVRIIAVSCYLLTPATYCQETIFADENRKRAVTRALDTIHNKWGEFTVTTGRMLNMEKRILDRISFGNTRGMSDVTL